MPRPLNLAFLALASLALAQAPPRVSQERLRDHLEFVASDLMEGRDTPSRGLDVTALYLATQCKLMGLRSVLPGGSYWQTIPLSQPRVEADSLVFEVNGKALQAGTDYAPRPTQGAAQGEMVYLGNGWVVPAQRLDPYQGVDIKGKIAVVNGQTPDGVSLRRGSQTDAVAPAQAALQRGAVAIVQINRLPGAASIESSYRQATQSRRASPPGEPGGATIPTVTMTQAAADAAFGQGAANGEMKPGTKLGNGRLEIKVTGTDVRTQNVVAVIEGRDPQLKGEYIAIGAHYDHLGLANQGEDRVFNGADDDGSGTVSLLEIARVLSLPENRPKRSVVFVWHTGEERGLWGSDFFTKNPPFPRENIVAQLNIDMIGRSRTSPDPDPKFPRLTARNEVHVVGARRLSTELGDVIWAVNKKTFNLSLNTAYDAPDDPERIYFRSDHYNYARYGIPVAFFFSGIHEDYHRVSDEVEKIDFVKMADVAQTVAMVAKELGNRKDRPKVDKPIEGGR
ncbi:MAG: M28 family peptidase [Fimbriimonadaceae bacterium]|nr:MAG: M28 family peptidase [Fimbriimonadaceae bacterium]